MGRCPVWPSHISIQEQLRGMARVPPCRGVSGSHPLAAWGSGQCDLGEHSPLHELSFLLPKNDNRISSSLS